VKISLIVPCLNEEHILPLFLESLTRQTYREFEVIFIDGGSRVRTWEIINSYRDGLNIKLLVDSTRNIGYILNLGAKHASGQVLIHTSPDVIYPEWLLETIALKFLNNDLIALGCRTRSWGASILPKIGYACFDFLRWLFTLLPHPLKKFRPSGNLFAIRQKVFHAVGGFPEVKINEDGLLGMKVDAYCAEHGGKVAFDLKLYIRHWARRFEKQGFKTFMFYIYVLGNMFPFLRKLLLTYERVSGEVFASR